MHRHLSAVSKLHCFLQYNHANASLISINTDSERCDAAARNSNPFKYLCKQKRAWISHRLVKGIFPPSLFFLFRSLIPLCTRRPRSVSPAINNLFCLSAVIKWRESVYYIIKAVFKQDVNYSRDEGVEGRILDVTWVLCCVTRHPLILPSIHDFISNHNSFLQIILLNKTKQSLRLMGFSVRDGVKQYPWIHRRRRQCTSVSLDKIVCPMP